MMCARSSLSHEAKESPQAKQQGSEKFISPLPAQYAAIQVAGVLSVRRLRFGFEELGCMFSLTTKSLLTRLDWLGNVERLAPLHVPVFSFSENLRHRFCEYHARLLVADVDVNQGAVETPVPQVLLDSESVAALLSHEGTGRVFQDMRMPQASVFNPRGLADVLKEPKNRDPVKAIALAAVENELVTVGLAYS
jgi:hypothetical protein